MSRIDKIKMYKESEDKKALNNVVEETKEYHTLMGKIVELQPRIAELIETVNACIKNGIEINKYRNSHCYSGYDNYKQGTFVSNAISHKIGFIQGNGVSFGYNPKTPITVMGIVNGGACGKLDFHTNGINAYSVHEDTKEMSKARIKDIKKFLDNFDEFEKAFYEYVDSIVG